MYPDPFLEWIRIVIRHMITIPGGGGGGGGLVYETSYEPVTDRHLDRQKQTDKPTDRQTNSFGRNVVYYVFLLQHFLQFSPLKFDLKS